MLGVIDAPFAPLVACPSFGPLYLPVCFLSKMSEFFFMVLAVMLEFVIVVKLGWSIVTLVITWLLVLLFWLF